MQGANTREKSKNVDRLHSVNKNFFVKITLIIYATLQLKIFGHFLPMIRKSFAIVIYKDLIAIS